MTFRTKLLSLPFLACVLFACSTSRSAPLTAFGVDADLGGFMTLTPNVQQPVQSPIVFTAKNSSGSATYHNVSLALEFFYPSDDPPKANGPGYVYQGGGIWAGGGQQLNINSVDPPYTSVMQLLDPSQILVPLTDTSNGFTASLSTSDSIPLIQLGDFAPGQSKSFNVNFTQPVGGNFRFLTDSFFVAPEPGTITTAAIGAALLVIAARRKMRN